MKNPTNKTSAGWIAALFAFLVLSSALTAGLFYIGKSNLRHRIEIENNYQQNLLSASESLNNLEINMSKLLVSADSCESALILNDAYHHAQSAMRSLSALPVNHEDRITADKFLNQLSDWCHVQSKKMIGANEDTVFAISYNTVSDTAADSDGNETATAGQEISESENGQSLYESQAEQLYIRVARLNETLKDAILLLDGKYKMLNGLKDGIISDFSLYDTNQKDSSDYPQLIYDGPFSDGQNAKNFKALDNLKEIDLDQAIKKAEETFIFLGLRNTTSCGETSSPDAYVLCGATNNGEMYLNVSKKGGKILFASLEFSPHPVQTLSYGQDFAKERAVRYAGMCGYTELSPVWYNESDGSAIVNLAKKTDGVICYTDLVKIKVDLIDGGFLGLEAAGFCACSHDRGAKLKPLITADEAARFINKRLNIYSCKLALIRKDGGERLCYEFAAEYKGLDYFIYIDARDGRQTDILRVMDNGQGKLVM